jgi:hypothetical protein
MTPGGVERVPSPGGAYWLCGLPAVCGEKLPGRRHKVRALCQAHADAVFGAADPPWRRQDARTRRDIAEDWLRGMTILAHGAGRPAEELLVAASGGCQSEGVRCHSRCYVLRRVTLLMMRAGRLNPKAGQLSGLPGCQGVSVDAKEAGLR